MSDERLPDDETMARMVATAGRRAEHHYDNAVELLERGVPGYTFGDPARLEVLAAAQVHATLALACATREQTIAALHAVL